MTPFEELLAAARRIRADRDALRNPAVAAATAYLLVLLADVFEDVPAAAHEQTRAEQAVLSLARAINDVPDDGRVIEP